MLKKIINNINHTQQVMIYISISFIIAMVIWKIDTNKPEPILQKNYNLQTEIPRGYNLYAIDVDNFNAINSLVDNYALVNLYQVFEDKKSKLALDKVKLIRSPKDPRYFAVLATDKELKTLTQFAGPFKVALQNPLLPIQREKKIKQKKRIITIEEN